MKYILVTGANSGVGYGLVERILRIYQKRSDIEEITIIFGCRNSKKALDAIEALKKQYPLAIGRVTLEFLCIDLTSIKSIKRATSEYHERFPRLDIFYANAGILAGKGINYVKATYCMLTNPVHFFKTSGDILEQTVGSVIEENEAIGQVFMANLLGHYILIKGLEDLLTKEARVIWTGSATASEEFFSFEDFQGLKSNYPYESSKYATQLVSNGLNRYFKEKQLNIKSFYTDPGSLCTGLMDERLPWFVRYFLMIPVIYIVSIFLDFVTFNAINGSEALLYLSGLPDDFEDMTVINELDTHKMYCSRKSWFSGKSYVAEEISLGSNRITDGVKLTQKLEKLRLATIKQE